MMSLMGRLAEESICKVVARQDGLRQMEGSCMDTVEL